MILYLIDTNVISELRRVRPHGGVLAWFAIIPMPAIAVPAIVIGEIQSGIEITRLSDPARAAELENWLDNIEASWNILAMDGRCFREWSRLMHATSDTLAEDAMIAATARVHDATVVTRNTRDFESFGVEVYNPFSYQG